MKIQYYSLFWLCGILFLGCQSGKPALGPNAANDPYRPVFHFAPPANWMNDPNGLVWYDGEYHLFYQYNPYFDTWGHMTWGHAVSKDLLHWKYLPNALNEEAVPGSQDSLMMFSGSVVVDHGNQSGLFGKSRRDGMVAIYTAHRHAHLKEMNQSQHIATSTNKGRTWTKYEHNPVLDIGRKDFRDPKVFWYEPERKWVMVLVVPDLFKTQFYESRDLRQWKLMSEFGPSGDISRFWECPDLYQVSIEKQPGKKAWVLSYSGGHPQQNDFSGMPYFIGQFDGHTFSTASSPDEAAQYLDYGKDFYAGVTFNNLPSTDERTLMIGWINNWKYAQTVPAHSFRGMQSFARELSLRRTPAGMRLIQQPARELKSLRQDHVHLEDFVVKDGVPYDLKALMGSSYELEMEVEVGVKGTFGVRVLKSEGEETSIGYRVAKNELFLDRTHSGNTAFNSAFPSIETAPLKPINGRIRLHVFVDHSVVEVFANDGERVITDLVFPMHQDGGISFFAEDSSFHVVSLDVWRLVLKKEGK